MFILILGLSFVIGGLSMLFSYGIKQNDKFNKKLNKDKD